MLPNLTSPMRSTPARQSMSDKAPMALHDPVSQEANVRGRRLQSARRHRPGWTADTLLGSFAIASGVLRVVNQRPERYLRQ